MVEDLLHYFCCFECESLFEMGCVKGCSKHVWSVVAAAKHCSLAPCQDHPFSKHPIVGLLKHLQGIFPKGSATQSQPFPKKVGTPWVGTPQFSFSRNPKGPKIEKFQDLEIFKRDWNFQASHPPNPLFFWEFWRSGLEISSEIEIFKRDWIFSIFGRLGRMECVKCRRISFWPLVPVTPCRFMIVVLSLPYLEYLAW